MAKKDKNFPMQGKRGGMGGRYGSKSTNLSKKTLKRAGAFKAASKRTVSQSDTRREGSRTLGPGGKPLTGTVTLTNGGTAVYKNGRRVQSADAKRAVRKAATAARSAPSRSTSSSASKSSSAVKKAAKPAAKKAAVKKAATRPTAKVAAQRKATQASMDRARKAASSRYSAQAKAAQGKPAASSSTSSGNPKFGNAPKKNDWISQTSAAAAKAQQSRKPSSSSSGPKVGDLKKGMMGTARWDGKKWVKVK